MPETLNMNLDKVLLDFSTGDSNNKDCWTFRDAVRGVQIFGGIGSGKTSGSGHTLANAFLKNGFGGLVLCAKPGERKYWEKLARETGRTNDLKIIAEPRLDQKEYFFNPLNYENQRKGGGETFNLVNLFMQIYQMGKIISGDGLNNTTERFWDNALKRCLSRVIDFLKIAGEPLSISNMNKLLTDAPTKADLQKLQNITSDLDQRFKELKKWTRSNYYIHCYFNSTIAKAYLIDHGKSKSELEEHIRISDNAQRYFEREFVNLAERTKTIVVESFMGLIEPFQSGILQRYFTGKTTITPEETFEQRKIIIVDFPIKNYLDSGIYAQGIFKLLWQQAVERRTYQEGSSIPVFLWVDEAHNFLTPYDQIFQTTARSAGACTVFITQNISNYYAAIGGKNPKSKVDSLLGNLSTKIFHANNDAVTNLWAADTIGKALRIMDNFQINQENTSTGGSRQYHYQVMPVEFTVLRSEKNQNNSRLEFDSVINIAGRKWSHGKNYHRHTFYKNFN